VVIRKVATVAAVDGLLNDSILMEVHTEAPQQDPKSPCVHPAVEAPKILIGHPEAVPMIPFFRAVEAPKIPFCYLAEVVPMNPYTHPGAAVPTIQYECQNTQQVQDDEHWHAAEDCG
jgi:hypothetical protein